jgi:outer membrane protein insertion porin family
MHPSFRVFFALLFCLISSRLPALTVSRVDVRARVPERPIQAAPVLAFIQPKVGDAYDPEVVNLDIRRLQETGRYAYVGVEVIPQGQELVLVYVIEERVRVRRMIVDGASHFSNSRVRDWLEINLSDRVDEALVRQKLETVREKYLKAFFPDVSFDINLTAPDAEGFSDLSIQVVEGNRQSVSRIDFEGNTEFSRTQLLRVMSQKETWIFSFLTGRGKLDDELLRQDMSAIEEEYRKLGYLDAKAGPPQITVRSGKRLHVLIPIEKNKLYRVNSIRIEGNRLFPSSLLGAEIPLSVGAPAGSQLVEKGRLAIRDFYNNRGYSQTGVRERVLVTAEGNKVDIVYQVQEGRVVKVRNVLIRGNTRTKDHVIRRELLVAPGDTLNEVNVRNSASRLRNLGFFDAATHTILPTEDPNVYDVEFEVKEGRSGQFLAGVGFSSEDSIVGFVELSQGNFDLMDPWAFTGGGEKLRTRVQLGTERRDAEITYTRPWFLDQRLTLSVSAFQNDRRFLSDDYDQRNTGVSVGLRKGLAGDWRAGVTYTLESIDVYNVDEDAAEIIQMEEGESIRSGLDFTLTHDTRNKVWQPTKGGRTVLNTGFTGGPLGFDTDIYEVGVRNSYFIPMVWDHVLNLQGWARSVDFYGDSDHVPIFDRLFLGGARSIRGFKFREVSPVDENGDEIGGQTSFLATAEYTIPLSEIFRYALFYDWGVVNSKSFDPALDEINSSFGMGLRIDITGFPLRLDYSWQNEASEHNDRKNGLFSFIIGHPF